MLLRGERPPDIWERDEAIVAWVYGSLLAGAWVVPSGVVATAPGQVLLYTTISMVVIWVAHSYAAFVGHGGRFDAGGLVARVRHAMGTELPVLASATPTLIALATAWLFGAGVASTALVGLCTAIATMAAGRRHSGTPSRRGQVGYLRRGDRGTGPRYPADRSQGRAEVGLPEDPDSG